MKKGDAEIAERAEIAEGAEIAEKAEDAEEKPGAGSLGISADSAAKFFS